MIAMHHQMMCFIILLITKMIKSDESFLYKSNRNSTTSFDCFYAFIIDDLDPDGKPLIPTNYLTPYCRRPLINDSIDDLQGYIESNHTFKSLRLQGVKTDHLLRWSISIDIIEQYAIYLSENDTQFDEFIFNNCSLSWFGSHCQYTFGSNMIIDSFGIFLNSSFTHRKQYEKQILIHTCYPYLSECYRGPEPMMCLDWREICDGKIDCIEGNFGIDEKYCNELEINECEENEYRCHNGAQCIPLAFFRDSWKSNDCLDGSDEDENYRPYADLDESFALNCIESMIFACEETMCRQPRAFSCGDGNCLGDLYVRNIVGRKNPACKSTGRDAYYNRAIYMSARQYPSDCYKLLFCKLKFYDFLENDTYNKQDCLYENWLSSINCTTKYLSFPLKPLFYGYFQPVYSSELLISSFGKNIRPTYICNDPRLCLHLRTATSQVDDVNLDCRRFQPLNPSLDLEYNLENSASICHLMGDINNFTSISSLFYCERSHRFISKHRLIDGIYDCYHREDEMYNDSCSLNDTQRFRCTSEEKCLSPIGIGLGLPDCEDREDRKIKTTTASVFPRLCNLFLESETEEGNGINDCEWWPCNTPYTRCDNYYHCANGIDELNCPNVNCKINEYKCSVSVFDDEYYCIPQEYIYEIPLDCDNNDFDTPCRHIFYSNSSIINIKNEYISWKEKICITKDDVCGDESINDQQFLCNFIIFSNVLTCMNFFPDLYSNETLCTLGSGLMDVKDFYIFSTWNLGYFPSTSLLVQQLVDTKPKKTLLINTSIELIEYCNRGIVIFEGKSFEKKCLCPPNYFGHRCQWQNQRVSLTLQILPFASYEKRIFIYHIFIYLIDDQYQIIHNYEEINYIPVIDCHTKYNRYLLYPNKPKNPNNTYSIHIDIYDKLTLDYYGSWDLFILFPFLPVNRISTQIQIPLEQSQPMTNCSIECGNHGKCFYYINNSTKSFCHCDQGYSGRFCNLTYNRSCSSDSVSLNSSICLCSLNKFGSKCYLQHIVCQPNNNPCKNHGQCVPINDRISKNSFICLCTEDYTGSYCEYKSNRIDITFKMYPIPSSIFAHFITAFNDRDPEPITIFKKVPFDRDSISLFIRKSFHILFIKFSNNYYLTVLREKYIPSEHISTDIKIDNMCVNITQILNSTLLSYDYRRRLKYYPLQCFQNQQLMCFYDENYLCVCDKTRFSNCFMFNHTLSYNCQGHNQCENGGQCFQNNITCPTTATCMCEKCYYGNKCQFTTKGFSLSLDVIFGYHIKSSVSFTKQSKAVKITASITILMFVLGLINGLLSILTFRRKSLIQVGCGIYLLTNSIISLLTICFFTIKYWQLIVFQMNIITNDSFIFVNCKLTDVLLKSLLSCSEWLNACVSIERAFTTIQGVRFNKSKSKYIAKYVILIILLMITISYIHDPISRQVFDDEDEERTWCIVNYSLKLKIFDIFINLFHFLTPFIINLLSALIIIIQVFRMRSKTKKNSTSKALFSAAIKQHKHILISPCVLIILAVPRLIILLSFQCMESPRDPWLFLIGYYVSFVPPLLIFVLFVLPSSKYTNEFLTVIRRQK